MVGDLTGKRVGGRNRVSELRDRIRVHRVTLTGDLDYQIPDGSQDFVHTVVFAQDGTGGHTVTYGPDTLAIDTDAGVSTLVEFFHDGAAWKARVKASAPSDEVVPGRILRGGWADFASGVGVSVVQRWLGTPVVVDRALGVGSFVTQIITAAVTPGATATAAIYSRTGPTSGTLLHTLGSFAIDSTGTKTVAVSGVTLQPGEYWIVALSTENYTVTGVRGFYFAGMGSNHFGGVTGNVFWTGCHSGPTELSETVTGLQARMGTSLNGVVIPHFITAAE